MRFEPSAIILNQGVINDEGDLGNTIIMVALR
jgi:hypothetical protein